jgi:hypothetical protein
MSSKPSSEKRKLSVKQWMHRRTLSLLGFACLLVSFWTIPNLLAQTDSDRPVPILTGGAGYFTFVTAGQTQLDTQVNPVLLLPLGDRWLVESRAEFEGAFERPPGGGPYGGLVSKNLDYLQVDYIANPYLTLRLPWAGF